MSQEKTGDLISQRKIRIEKMEKLRKMGIDPYPSKVEKDHLNSEIIENYDKYEGKTMKLTGRLMTWREHGHLVFGDIEDETGKIQLYIKEENVEDTNAKAGNIGWEDFELLDIGDFVQATGEITKTKSGEISILIKKLVLASKTIRPLPNKWSGLKDNELRFRRRYLDMTMNSEVRELMKRRSKFWQAHREFLNSQGFTEINIPVLEHIPGGGDATPFVTHMNAIDEDFYLRVSHELPLKRLIGGGFEKVYDIGPRFRNEGLSDEHLPEHVAMEFYWAYANWEDGMLLVKDLMNHVIDEMYGGQKQFTIRGHEVDFSKWDRIDFGEIVGDHFGIDVYDPDLKKIEKELQKAGVEIDFTLNIPRGIDNLWKVLRKDIAGPAFLINHPIYLSPLQKPSQENPNMVERFQPIIAGSELGNGWSEVNDPIDQFERFSEQQRMRDSGDAEAQWLDVDYVEMLEYGMPPTFGYGHSERNFWFFEDVTAREGVPFPQLKHKYDENTIKIYGRENLPQVDADEDDFEKEVTLNGGSVSAESQSDTEDSDRKVDKQDITKLPTRKEATALLREHVKDEYQILHAKMVAAAMEAYAAKYDEDTDLWYITGLLHDLDYFEHPEAHPQTSVGWFKEWEYPEALIHAVDAHSHLNTGKIPETSMSKALIAIDELSGLIYAYSLMRPDGFKGMKAKSLKKKFKDKAFAAKIDRDEINYGVEQLGVDLGEHMVELARIFETMPEFKTDK
ncbi:lysine--tRNA ligase [Candidatus Dojkabacteria bacterium]|nr:lysine--tRNA ligase [Candidatus Dojkabacteria bacterium]